LNAVIHPDGHGIELYKYGLVIRFRRGPGFEKPGKVFTNHASWSFIMRSFGVILGLLGAINGLTLPLPRDLQAERRDVDNSNTTIILGRYIVEFAKVFMTAG
jgi:hypothetical protein